MNQWRMGGNQETTEKCWQQSPLQQTQTLTTGLVADEKSQHANLYNMCCFTHNCTVYKSNWNLLVTSLKATHRGHWGPAEPVVMAEGAFGLFFCLWWLLIMKRYSVCQLQNFIVTQMSTICCDKHPHRHRHMNICIQTHGYIHRHMSIHMHVCMHAHKHTYVQAHTHTHTHTHTRAHACTQRLPY